MTDTTTDNSATPAGSLTGLRLPQLQSLAQELGIKGFRRMRKSELITAIQAHAGSESPASPVAPQPAPKQSAEPKSAGSHANANPHQAQLSDEFKLDTAESTTVERSEAAPQGRAVTATGKQGSAQAAPAESADAKNAERVADSSAPDSEPVQDAGEDDANTAARGERRGRNQRRGRKHENTETPAPEAAEEQTEESVAGGGEESAEDEDSRPRSGRSRQDGRGRRRRRGEDEDTQTQDATNEDAADADDQRDSRERRGRRDRDGREPREGRDSRDNRDIRESDADGDDNRRGRNRGRDRKRRGRGDDDAPQLEEQLIPVGGILEVHENYAFLRTSGYLSGPNDVYVSAGMLKKHGLRKGDAIGGAIKKGREGDKNNRREKFDALTRLDSVNGLSPEEARTRVEFSKLTPLYPQERLRLETNAKTTTTRMIDLVSPIGKGQRGLIVAPPKAGKTTIMQQVANAITANNPEVHLMVVLVDERP